ncbi:ABC transporter permease subunit [Citrobacter amalonaticus]|uniref:ABC transporter permease subunit n=1 Tax=Citrobacter amalonaticus TaxID=35703 RepID=UPI002E7C133B|nr:hypothetical protein [Citrobacter amalonaticus]
MCCSVQPYHLLIVPAAALIAAVCGILLGAPTLKLRGDYLAIVTLGFGEIIRILMRNLDRPVNITNFLLFTFRECFFRRFARHLFARSA